ncbi:MAG: FAD-binding oxidoreductase [Methanomassiliicoccales archaeon]|nr:MAG: FAD-binding oxidoreductase [Methanomassiliicoccales archaeon]
MHKKTQETYNKIILITGKDRVRIDPFERRMYSHDLASLPKMLEFVFKTMPDLVVKPKSSEEISEIIKVAAYEGIPIVPRGGASWGLGGAMPVSGGIVFDLTRMNKILDYDYENLIVTVEPGITWKALNDNLIKRGYIIGSYPSSALAATVGGWINTGGVGVGTYKYGSAMDHLKSLEVVLPTGKILETGNFRTSIFGGQDLNRVFFGSEGTLGIVTRASLRIYPKPQEIRPISYGFSNFQKLSKVVRQITLSEVVPLHISFLDGYHFNFLRDLGIQTPDSKIKGMLNIALEGDSAVLDIEEKALDEIAAKHKAIKQDREVARHEWNERFYELRTKRAGPTATLGEVFVPISEMSTMVEATYNLIKRMKLRAAITGMVSDRNTAIFMPYYLSDERKLIRNMVSLSFVKKLGDLAFEHGGRPAGLGLFFSGNLKKMYDEGWDTMRDLKAIMDPYDIMNPGKTVEGLTRFGVPIPPFALNFGMDMMAGVKHIMTKDKKVVSWG